MRPRALPSKFLLCTFLFALAHSGSAQTSSRATHPEPAPASFASPANQLPILTLDGLWRFHPGDNPVYASPDFDDSAWPLLHSDQPWTSQGYGNLSGFAWYRFQVQPPLPPAPRSLLLPSILTDYEVFANGQKIGGDGTMPPPAPSRNGTNRDGSLKFNQVRLYALPPSPEGTPLHIAIRVWHHPIFATYLGGGPRYGGASLGPSTLLEDHYRLIQGERLNRIASFFALGILDAIISVTVFGLYFFRRSEREYLWFALLLLSSALLTLLVLCDFILNFPLGASNFLTETLGAINFASSLFFFSRVLEARRSWLWITVLLIARVDPLNVLLYMWRVISPAQSTTLRISFDLPIVFYIVALLSIRAIQGNRNARLLFLPTILLSGTNILGGILLLSFELGQRWPNFASINQWNLIQTPFPVPLQVLVQFVFVAALLAFLIRRFARSRAREERYSADIEAARTLQNVLIPETLPTIPTLQITTAYHPAQEVGGDFYQILPIPPGTPGAHPETLIVLGDVAGKGLPAAMTVSMLVGALRTLIESTDSPAAILAGLNRRLIGRGSGFTTCLVLRLSPTGSLTLANAGHLAPYRNGQEIPTTPSLPLGLDPNADFGEETLQLNPGDRLTLLTDGIPEATSHRQLFGFERTARISNSPAATIAAAALEFGQEDDITVLSVVATH